MFALKRISCIIVSFGIPWASTGSHDAWPFVFTQRHIAYQLVPLIIQSLHLFFNLVTQDLSQIRGPFFAVNHFIQFVIHEFFDNVMHVLWIKLPLGKHPISGLIFLGWNCHSRQCPFPLGKSLEELLGRQHAGQWVTHLLGGLGPGHRFFGHWCYAVSSLLAHTAFPFNHTLLAISRGGGLTFEIRSLLFELLLGTRFHFCQHVYLVYLWVGLSDNHQGLYIDSTGKKCKSY